MKKSFVDTNIFVETFVRTGAKSDAALKFLQKGINLCTTSLVVSEVEWVMRAGYEVAKEDIVRGLRKIIASDIEVDQKKLLVEVLDYYATHAVDWTDCLNMFLMKEEGISVVYSFDKGLQKFPWIKRIEP